MQAEPSLLWIGDSEQADELRLTVASLQPVITTSCLPTAAAAFGAAGYQLKPPTVICLAERRPGNTPLPRRSPYLANGPWPG